MDLPRFLEHLKNYDDDNKIKNKVIGNYSIQISKGFLKATSLNINYVIKEIKIKIENRNRLHISISYVDGKNEEIRKYIKRLRECLNYGNISMCLGIKEKVSSILEKILGEVFE